MWTPARWAWAVAGGTVLASPAQLGAPQGHSPLETLQQWERLYRKDLDIMMDVINKEEISLEDGILHHQENVDLLPANIELSTLEVTMGNVMSREMIMKEYIDAIRCRYDYILMKYMDLSILNPGLISRTGWIL